MEWWEGVEPFGMLVRRSGAFRDAGAAERSGVGEAHGVERSRTSIPKGGADSHHGRDGPNPGGLDKLIRIWPERGETAQIFSSDRFGQFRSVSEPYVYVKDLERIFNRLLLGLAAKPQYLYLKFFSVFGDLNTSDRVGVLSYSIVFCRALCF